MNHRTTTSRQGHDAACSSRDQDHLNRWPLAREVYRIAVDGPEAWSVRVGIYGEWGSGKSSVLNFIESMAADDGHVAFHFNPWQYHSKDDLWKAFVSGLFEKIENDLGQPVAGKASRTTKNIGSSVVRAIPRILSIWKNDAGKAAEAGLGLLKKYLSFKPEDLQELKSALDGRRLLVTIDDLDRTDGQLVPEILYALKELMDVPGMAFICAFDPVVVGKVLGQAHPGHDDGLKFLEKIIDYPRWLPEPTTDQLLRLAQVEVQSLCLFVPSEHLDGAIPLLPANPRSIRQFIRILALLSPQIERHHPWELQWPVILAANVLKVRFPHLAQTVLRNQGFWEEMYQATLFREKKDDQVKEAIDKQIRTLVGSTAGPTVELRSCIESLADRADAWTGVGKEALQYQFNLAEAPHAVTWKEFDHFFESCAEPNTHGIVSWAEDHSRNVEEPVSRVFDELLGAVIARRKSYLDQAANSTTKSELKSQMDLASRCLRIIILLIPIHNGMHIASRENCFRKLMDQFAEYYSWRNEPKYRTARRDEEKCINLIFDMASPDWQVWLKVIGLYSCHSGRGLDRPEWVKLEQTLKQRLREHCASWLIDQISTQNDFVRGLFGDEAFGNQFRAIFLDANGPVWTKCRPNVLKQLTGKVKSIESPHGRQPSLVPKNTRRRIQD